MIPSSSIRKKAFHHIQNLDITANISEPMISMQRQMDLREKLELEKNALKLVNERSKKN
jgi:hypothetical protein